MNYLRTMENHQRTLLACACALVCESQDASLAGAALLRTHAPAHTRGEAASRTSACTQARVSGFEFFDSERPGDPPPAEGVAARPVVALAAIQHQHSDSRLTQ